MITYQEEHHAGKQSVSFGNFTKSTLAMFTHHSKSALAQTIFPKSVFVLVGKSFFAKSPLASVQKPCGGWDAE